MAINDSIQKTKGSLSQQVSAYSAARSECRALDAYPDVGSLLAALDLGSPLTDVERGALVDTLIHLHRMKGGRLFQSILIVAFGPALQSLRRSLRRPKSEDIDQDVILAFTEALRSPAVASAGMFAPRALMLATGRRALARVRKERARPKHEVFDEASKEAETLAAVIAESRELDAATLAKRFLAVADTGEIRDVLIATVAGEESLKHYIARRLPALSKKEQELEYERLRHHRYRALRRLRAMPAPEEA